jgi:predicted lysophospholipase L1 biosynthesis ABC-type transport system permease subunit
VAVVSDRWWRAQLGADPAVMGRVVHLNGAPFTIVGVAPASFRGSYDAAATDLWVPLMTYGSVRPRGLDVQRRNWGWLQASARLAPGVSVETAQAEVRAIGEALAAEYPAENRALRMTVTPASAVPESMTPLLSRVLVFAFIVTALALVAACANVANAQLAAVTDRSTEIAVRMAMGATRVDVARQWLAESLATTAAATAVGLLAAVWLRDGFLALQPLTGLANFAPAANIDWRVWACAALLMAGATCLSGVLPALRAARVDPARPLQEGAAASVGSPRNLWMSAGLVSAQAAVSLTLLVMAALLGRSISESAWFDVGFDPSRLVVATANTSGLGLDATRSYAYHADALGRVRALPGVEAATAAAVVPLGEAAPGMALCRECRTIVSRCLCRVGHIQSLQSQHRNGRRRKVDGNRFHQRHPAQRLFPTPGPLAVRLRHQLLLFRLRLHGHGHPPDRPRLNHRLQPLCSNPFRHDPDRRLRYHRQPGQPPPKPKPRPNPNPKSQTCLKRRLS